MTKCQTAPHLSISKPFPQSWVKGTTGSGSSLHLSVSSDSDIYVAIDNDYDRTFSTGSVSCTISNKDYDLSHPSWTPPSTPKAYSPYIYAVADGGDSQGGARVHWEGNIDYGVVGYQWLAPIWALWVVVVGAILLISRRSNVSAAEKGASLINSTPAANLDYAQVAVVEEPVIASVVPSPSAPPK